MCSTMVPFSFWFDMVAPTRARSLLCCRLARDTGQSRMWTMGRVAIACTPTHSVQRRNKRCSQWEGEEETGGDPSPSRPHHDGTVVVVGRARRKGTRPMKLQNGPRRESYATQPPPPTLSPLPDARPWMRYVGWTVSHVLAAVPRVSQAPDVAPRARGARVARRPRQRGPRVRHTPQGQAPAGAGRRLGRCRADTRGLWPARRTSISHVHLHSGAPCPPLSVARQPPPTHHPTPRRTAVGAPLPARYRVSTAQQCSASPKGHQRHVRPWRAV